MLLTSGVDAQSHTLNICHGTHELQRIGFNNLDRPAVPLKTGPPGMTESTAMRHDLD
jgi:hypothetical protein